MPPSLAASSTASGVNASRWAAPEDDEKGTVVLVAEASERSRWWTNGITYPKVLLKNPTSAQVEYAAVSILKFIVDNYADLPPRMIFVNAPSVDVMRPVCARNWLPVWSKPPLSSPVPHAVGTQDINETLIYLNPRAYDYAGFSGVFNCFHVDDVNREWSWLSECWADMKGDEFIDTLPSAAVRA